MPTEGIEKEKSRLGAMAREARTVYEKGWSIRVDQDEKPEIGISVPIKKNVTEKE